jgi:hypothetical protein
MESDRLFVGRFMWLDERLRTKINLIVLTFSIKLVAKDFENVKNFE